MAISAGLPQPLMGDRLLADHNNRRALYYKKIQLD